jgi:glycosyltransferase involved in cell wall biosynthesis
MTDGRPAALFVAPVMPAPAGNGLAMRAAMTLDALAAGFAVHLLVVPVSGGARRASAFVRSRTESVAVEVPAPEDDHLAGLDPARTAALAMASPRPLACRFATPAFRARIAARYAGRRFALVHVMRLYMAPYAADLIDGPAVLDLDDDEPRTRERVAALLALRGEAGAARLEAREAERYAALEPVWQGRFCRILVGSEADRERLVARLAGQSGEGRGGSRIEISPPLLPASGRRGRRQASPACPRGKRVRSPHPIALSRLDGSRLAVVPNAVRLPALAPPHRPDGTRRLLFVGTLGYLPNADAAAWLCRDILPLLREQMGEAVGVRIVGNGAGPEVQALGMLEGVELAGGVADLGARYRQAEVVVVPVRAGGGTRIKLLEALAHARPVVATTIGAEGIDVTVGRHLLIADSPTEFAAACARLLRDPVLAADLAANGHARVAETYGYDAIVKGLARLFAATAAPNGVAL